MITRVLATAIAGLLTLGAGNRMRSTGQAGLPTLRRERV